MITLWTDELILDKNKISDLKQQLKQNSKYHREHHYTSYFTEDVYERPEIIFCEEYKQQIIKFLKSMNLLDSTTCNFEHWSQLYPAGSGYRHTDHTHFRFDNLFSWVHFVESTDELCFYFRDCNGEQHFIPKQSSGTFVVFPTWAIHGAKGNYSEKDRLVVAGNISSSEFAYDNEKFTYIRASDNTCIVEKSDYK